MSAERVSVVMAVLNGAERLPQALESIRAQTVPVAEIVLVDGGSADGTREIASAAPDVRLVDQVGPSLASAYNTGIREAAGTHVAFLSHDDLWLPHKVELQLERLRAAPPADAVVGHAQFVVEPGDAPPPGFRPELLDGPRPARIMETLLAPRPLFDRVGPLRPEVSPADDVDWFARAHDLGVHVAVLPDVILRKRVHDASTAHTAAGTQPGLLRAMHAAIARKRAAESA